MQWLKRQNEITGSEILQLEWELKKKKALMKRNSDQITFDNRRVNEETAMLPGIRDSATRNETEYKRSFNQFQNAVQQMKRITNMTFKPINDYFWKNDKTISNKLLANTVFESAVFESRNKSPSNNTLSYSPEPSNDVSPVRGTEFISPSSTTDGDHSLLGLSIGGGTPSYRYEALASPTPTMLGESPVAAAVIVFHVQTPYFWKLS
uniref:Uncharacterized protein n=1 Tax=Amphora coffeiformis TaxID=265554 RepID=A0A7S3L667_9STRA|mmetsp:Transcript_15194/g.30916  ORF Transcript_15194/g.30916 Transcript_15194/m.30916 type:complete len:207 (+) Transcript_15194:277-897(+)|eukprot:scaffold310_cov168-Amphora_coffeaeformis.AAC.54